MLALAQKGRTQAAVDAGRQAAAGGTGSLFQEFVAAVVAALGAALVTDKAAPEIVQRARAPLGPAAFARPMRALAVSAGSTSAAVPPPAPRGPAFPTIATIPTSIAAAAIPVAAVAAASVGFGISLMGSAIAHLPIITSIEASFKASRAYLPGRPQLLPLSDGRSPAD